MTHAFDTNVLIHYDWWTLCGRVGEMVGPHHFRLFDASVILRTNAAKWDELARGQNRHLAKYRFRGDLTCMVPLFQEWADDLPTEAVNRANTGLGT